MVRSKHNNKDGERHGIRMPGTILDSIKDREEKGDYTGDNRYTAFDKKRKFGGKPKSRKEKRQEERKLKKQKRSNVSTNNGSHKESHFNDNQKGNMATNKPKKAQHTSISLDEHSDEEDPMEALKKLKKNNSTNDSEIRIVKEDDLEDDSFSDFDEDELVDSENEEMSEENDDDVEEEDEEYEEDPMEALRKLKAKNKSRTTTDLKIVKEDDLNDDSFSDFDDDENEAEVDDKQDPLEALKQLKKGKSSGLTVRIVKEDDLEDDSFSDDDDGELLEEEQDPLEALRKLKKGKASGSSHIRIVKEDDLEDDSMSEEDVDDEEEHEEEALPSKLKSNKDKESKGKAKKEKVVYDIPPLVREQIRKDEEEMEYYAKKLGLKNGKHSKLNKTDDDDVIGGLLDGLDLDFESDLNSVKQSYELDSESEEQPTHKQKEENNAYGSDDSISDGDFDSDLDSELEELYGKQRDMDGSDDDFDNGSTIPSKENPFVAPTQDDENSGGYIPPALRRKMALEAGEMTEEALAIQRKIKGSLNKLSEGNVSTIVNDVNGLFLENPRHLVIENLTNIIIDGVVAQGRLLETFVHLQSCVVSAIYKLQGVEFGAHFIQALVERFLKDYQNSTKTKEVSNIVSLLSTVYTFQLVSSRLIYDLIKLLINEFNESNAEILLRLIKNCGNQIRADDPTGLKEIILMMNKVSSSMKELNPRTQFLIETINSLKNNKMKVGNDFSHELSIRLKKFLGTLGSNQNDPLQVGLEDIKNVETKGKWWLVGAAWKGNDDNEQANNFDLKAMNEILDSAEPNWVQIAKEQRMNTDIRRAIFITIMSADDYVDAITKLDKLQLKKAQEREIPRILIHCVSIEQSWNPYYGLLATKLAESHSYRKTIQFLFWDVLREFESSGAANDSDNEDFVGFDVDNENEDAKVKRIYNLGRFFGFLMAEGSLPLHSLKNVNFLVASSDIKLFVEIMLVTFLDLIAKKSQINIMGTGIGGKTKTSDMRFSDQLLIERILKSKEQTSLLRGLQYFVQEKTLKSTFVDGKRQKKRIEWGSNAMFDIIDELLKNAEDQ